jgi:glycosyltransferase involved in cell wall biosynthesis
LTTPFRIVVVEQLPLPSRSAFVRRWRRQASRLYGAHVAVGEASARAIEREFRLLPGSVRAVHNGIVPREPGARPAHGDGQVIGTLGRLVQQKGHEVLLEALTELPGARAVIVGEGPNRSELERLARQLGVDDRLELPGWSDDAPGRLPTFDVFVLPSHDEGLPLAMLEAMAAGVPVVASDVGSIREAVEHDRSGLLVRPGDPHALAAAVRSLLDDADRRTRLVEAARRTVLSSFTAAVMASRYEHIYDEVLA